MNLEWRYPSVEEFLYLHDNPLEISLEEANPDVTYTTHLNRLLQNSDQLGLILYRAGTSPLSTQKPISMFGVLPVSRTKGAVWAVYSSLEYPKIPFIRLSQEVMKRWTRRYKTLYCSTKGDTSVIKWLTFLGFSVESKSDKGTLLRV